MIWPTVPWRLGGGGEHAGRGGHYGGGLSQKGGGTMCSVRCTPHPLRNENPAIYSLNSLSNTLKRLNLHGLFLLLVRLVSETLFFMIGRLHIFPFLQFFEI